MPKYAHKLLEELTQKANSLDDDDLTALIASLVQKRYTGDFIPPADTIFVRVNWGGERNRTYQVL